jgi:hypothetical protein
MAAKSKKPRILYKGVFNFSYEMVIKYLYASSPGQAKIYMMRRIAVEHGVSCAHVFGLFDGSKDNFRIEVEPIENRGLVKAAHRAKKAIRVDIE